MSKYCTVYKVSYCVNSYTSISRDYFYTLRIIRQEEVPALCRFPVSLVNLRQRVAKIYFPPPLDVTQRMQRSQNSGEQQSMSRASSSWWFIISRNQESTRIHNNHSCTTIMNWFRRTCKESKTTFYYWLYTMIIVQFTGLLNIDICFSFTLLCFFFKTRLIYWPWKPAKQMRQNNPPEKPTSKIRHENLPDLWATKTRQIYSPEKPATSTRGLLAREPPFPAQNPQARPGPPSLPPPSSFVNGEGGEGAGSRPSPPTHPEQVLLLSFPFHEWLHILIWHNIYIFCIERTNMKHNYIAVGERTIC